MRLNPDCIRDILLTAEELIDAENEWTLSEHDIPTNLSKYTYNEIVYHLKQCDQNGYFTNVSEYVDGSYCIKDLSPTGHAFLEQLRDNTTFKKIKKMVVEKGIAFTFAAIKTILPLIS